MTQKIYESLIIGDKQGGNYLEILKNGMIRAFGAATCWDDLVGNLVGQRLSSTAGKVDYNYANNSITMQSGGSITTANDILLNNLQIPHAAKADGALRQHLHWEQPDDKSYIWTRRWRLQSNNSLKTTSWTEDTATAGTDDVFTYPGSGTLIQITEFPEVDITGVGISGTFQWRLARTDSEVGNVEVVFFDTHVELDSNGSDFEYSKF